MIINTKRKTECKKNCITLLTLLFTFIFLSFFQTSCSIIGGDSGDDLKKMRIDSVQYVGKIYNSERHIDFTETTFAFSIDIFMSKTFDINNIKRLTIFPENEESNLGWEIENLSDLTVEGNVIKVENLVFEIPRFEIKEDLSITIEWNDESLNTYKFSFYSSFIIPIVSNLEWIDHEILRISITDRSANQYILDSLTIFWLDDDFLLGSSKYAANKNNSNIIFADEVPATASSFYVKASNTLQNSPTDYFSGDYAIPERIPTNMTFIEGAIIKHEEPNFNKSLTYNNRFYAIASDISASEENKPELLIIDPIQKTLINSIGLKSGVSSYAISDSIVYIGYFNGLIEKIEVSTGNRSDIITFEWYPVGMLLIKNWLLASSGRIPSESVLTIDLSTKKIIHKSPFYGQPPSYLVYSSKLKKGFTNRGNGSGKEIYGFDFDESEGKITDFRLGEALDAPYSLYPPLYMSPDHSEVIASGGTVYSAIGEDELEYRSSFKYTTISPVFDPVNDRMYSIRNERYQPFSKSLDIYRLSDMEHLRNISFADTDPYLLAFQDGKLYMLSIYGNEFLKVAVSEFNVQDMEPSPKKVSDFNYLKMKNISW